MMLEDSDKAAIRAAAEHAAMSFSLPFRNRVWRGLAGNWHGVGSGSSLDFQDHRAYVPGDDPRYINWLAYARTGQYTMKLYRPEISPVVDLALDATASMRLTKGKWVRTLELVYFCLASAVRAGAALRVYLTGAGRALLLDNSRIHSLDFGELPGQVTPSAGLESVPWRANSLRVIVSDLLFEPGAAEGLMRAFGPASFTIILAPWTTEESDPGWEGLLELRDVETQSHVVRKITSEMLRAYKTAYQKHFDWWRDFVRRRHGVLARVAWRGSLTAALAEECVPNGALEVC